MIVTVERGLGLTTQQILAAPQKAVYVALNPMNALYVRDLSRRLGRSDLQVVVPGWLARSYANLDVTVVIDHAVTIEAVSRSDRSGWHRALDVLEQRGLLSAAVSTAGQTNPAQ